jgi:hypothetical protein
MSPNGHPRRRTSPSDFQQRLPTRLQKPDQGLQNANFSSLLILNRQLLARVAMKSCAQCGGRLGLGVRARNLWNGLWWVHVRLCSTHCEARYELERYNAKTHSWRAVVPRRVSDVIR